MFRLWIEAVACRHGK